MATGIMLFIAISALILAHELGHFYVARWLKVKVEEFGFGFPPRLFSKVKNGIHYSFNALPFGGFVKIYGEVVERDAFGNVNPDILKNPNSFFSHSARHRLLILVAGVLMNLVLAWVLFSIVSAIGMPQISDDVNSHAPVSIINVSPHSPAEAAGLHFGDHILELRADKLSLRVEKEKDVSDFVDGFRGEEITLVVERGTDIKDIIVTPRAHAPAGEGPLGVGMGRLELVRVPLWKAPIAGIQILWQTFWGVVVGILFILKELIFHGHTDVSVSGPVGIYFFGRDVQQLGWAYILQFVGMLSVNLAVLNVLPIPALDGGRIFFILIEKLRGSRLNPAFEARAHAVGFALLIVLMAVVTYKDIVHLL